MADNEWPSSYAKTYATSSAAQIPDFFANIAARKLLEIPISLQPITFLDVASGPGSLTERLLYYATVEELKIKSVTVTDYSAGMIDSAAEAINALNYANVQKKYYVMDAQDLKFDDKSFTHLGCMFGIMFFPDRLKGLREMYRVLQSGGLAVIGTWSYTNAVEIIPDLAAYAALPHIEENVASINTLVHICSDPVEFTAELRAVGFTDIEVHTEEHFFALPNNVQTYLTFANNTVQKKALDHHEAMELYPSWQEYLQGPGKERWLDEDGMIRVHYVANIAVARK